MKLTILRRSGFLSLPIILLGMPLVASAQSIPNAFEAEYTYSFPSEGDLEDEVEIHEGKVGVLVPLTTRKEDGVGFAVGGQFQVDVWSPDTSRIENLELYKVKVPVIVDFDVMQDLSMAVGATPGIHSDFEEVDSDDWRVDGTALLSWVVSDELVVLAGAGIGEEFGDVEGYPMGGVRWTTNDAWLIDLFFPRPRVQWALSDGFHLYAFGEPSGGEWNVGDRDAQVDIQQKGYRAGVGMEFGLGESNTTWLYLAAGVEGNRELQLAVNEEDVFDDEVDLDDQAFVRGGIRVARW